MKFGCCFFVVFWAEVGGVFDVVLFGARLFGHRRARHRGPVGPHQQEQGELFAARRPAQRHKRYSHRAEVRAASGKQWFRSGLFFGPDTE